MKFYTSNFVEFLQKRASATYIFWLIVLWKYNCDKNEYKSYSHLFQPLRTLIPTPSSHLIRPGRKNRMISMVNSLEKNPPSGHPVPEKFSHHSWRLPLCQQRKVKVRLIEILGLHRRIPFFRRSRQQMICWSSKMWRTH